MGLAAEQKMVHDRDMFREKNLTGIMVSHVYKG